MTLEKRHSKLNTKTTLQDGGSFLSIKSLSLTSRQSGSVIFYIFLAVGLLGYLTFSLTKNSRTNTVAQSAFRMTEDLTIQANAIKVAVLECVGDYPGGGGDLDGNGSIEAADNDNPPYPLSPSDPNNPSGGAGAGNNDVRDLECPGAPDGQRAIYDGVGTTGRFLAPPKNGFGEWEYFNDADGVRLKLVGGEDASTIQALNAIDAKHATCQVDVDYGSCGSGCLTMWLIRAACP